MGRRGGQCLIDRRPGADSVSIALAGPRASVASAWPPPREHASRGRRRARRVFPRTRLRRAARRRSRLRPVAVAPPLSSVFRAASAAGRGRWYQGFGPPPEWAARPAGVFRSHRCARAVPCPGLAPGGKSVSVNEGATGIGASSIRATGDPASISVSSLRWTRASTISPCMSSAVKEHRVQRKISGRVKEASFVATAVMAARPFQVRPRPA